MASNSAAEVMADIVKEVDEEEPAAKEVKRAVGADRARLDLQARLGVFHMQLLAAGHASGCAPCGSLNFVVTQK